MIIVNNKIIITKIIITTMQLIKIIIKIPTIIVQRWSHCKNQ